MSLKLTVYNSECLNLAKSLLIKSDLLARDVEYALTGTTTYLDRNRTTWKYYLTMSGEYHETNEMMYVTSLDTLTRIEFTKENLANHPVTKEKYTPNGELTNELIALYPENEALIIGIIYAVDINELIESDEFTIHAYDSSLVGVQEINLIPDLQTRLYAEYNSFTNKDYADIEPYYALAEVSNLAKQALIGIKTIRLANFKTARACDYYMWTYINSKLYLEDLKDNLKKEDIFYLYKNIDRLVRRAGSNDVLYELIRKFLTTKNITTYQLNYVKDVSDINQLTGDINLDYKEVGIGEGIADKVALFSEYIEDAIESSNTKLDDYEQDIIERMEYSPNRNETRELKVFELVKNSTDTQILLVDLDVHVQGFIEGYYTTTVNITNHLTSRVYSLGMKEVFILYKYLILLKLGLTPDTIQPHAVYYLPRKELPSISYLATKYNISTTAANDILEQLPTFPEETLSRSEMDEYILQVKRCYGNVIREVRKNMTRHNQASLSMIYHELFFNSQYELAPEGTTYADWLSLRGIDLSEFTALDIGIMETAILDDAFNIDLSTRTSGYALALTELLRRFNNYNVNVRTEAGSDNLVDYHLSPILHDATFPDEVVLIVQGNLGVIHKADAPQTYPLVKHNTLKSTNILEDKLANELSTKYKNKALTYKSEVVTPMSNQYNTPVELRNM